MPNRIIKESICTSDTIDNLTPDEECFFYRIMVNCDDFGRLDARIPVLTSKCYPLKSSAIKKGYVEKMLVSLQKTGILFLYGGGKYLQVKTWEKHQQIRAKRSKYPEPDDSEIICNQLISDDGICHRNPIQSESESNPNPNPPKAYDYFSDFWKEYPYKDKKIEAQKSFAKLKMDDELMEKIMLSLVRFKRSEKWLEQNGKFIPMAVTWINQKRWEDG